MRSAGLAADTRGSLSRGPGEPVGSRFFGTLPSPMRRTPLVVVAALIAAAALPASWTACAKGGGSDEAPRKREVLLQSEAQDEKVGREAAAQVRAQMGLVERADLVAYVDEIGRRLLRFAPRRGFEYSFTIIDQAAPNAFALPGGPIFVSRGLLVLANSEDELANVLAHEIVHVAARHAAARQAVSQGLPPGPFAYAAMGQIAAYGRDQEREADRLGQGLAGLAGYDPRGMADFLRGLEFGERLQFGRSRLPSFFDTHPVTTERVATAANRAGVIRWTRVPELANEPDGYLRRIEGLVVGPSAREGVFQGDRFVHPSLGFSLRFPGGWEVLNTQEAVGAFSPKRDAQVFLQAQGLGLDPRLSAEEFLKSVEKEFRLQTLEPLKIGGFDAVRATGRATRVPGGLDVMMTWVSFNSTMYRITGAALSSRYLPAFMSVARSFRPATPEQLAAVTERRLVLARARQGEDLSSFSARTGNRWNVQETAIMNGVFTDQPLEGGQLLKIAREERYLSPAQER